MPVDWQEIKPTAPGFYVARFVYDDGYGTVIVQEIWQVPCNQFHEPSLWWPTPFDTKYDAEVYGDEELSDWENS